MQFFKEEKFKIIIDPVVKVISEFRLLIAKDKDRNKREVLKWFAYIYYTNDYRSPYFNLPSDERRKQILKQLELPANFKEFKELNDATERYLQFQDTAAVLSLKAIREGLVVSSRVINMLTSRTEAMLEKVMEATESGDDDEDTFDQIDAVTKGVTRMLDLSDKLPKAISTITALEEEVKKEQANDSKIRGGGQRGAFED